MKKRNKIIILGLIIGIISSGTIVSLFIFDVIQNASPSARYGSAMVYDPVLKKAILFGGGYQDSNGYENYNDMWLFDPVSNIWTEINPIVKPLPRAGHAMVYDPVNLKTLLFGGWVDTIGIMNDTWIYDSQTNQWTEVFPANHPSYRQSFSMYYDSDAQRVILFGGYREIGGHLDDMWEYNYTDNSWTERSPLTSPSGRYGSRMVYDPIHEKAILFGGRTTTIMDDTWDYYYINNTWLEKSISIKPDTRYWHGMVYDSNNQKVIVFGGRHAGAPGDSLEDTWIYDPSTNEWTEVVPATNPSNRMDSSVTYDNDNQKVILFGGFRFQDNTLGDTWAYNYISNSWTIIKGTDP